MQDAKVAATATKKKSPSSSSSSNERPLSLTDQVQSLQKRVDALEQENANLQRNMGTLFRTATAELKRKDAHIRRLQEELDHTTTKRSA